MTATGPFETGCLLRLIEDRLAPGAAVLPPLRAVDRVIYVFRGEIRSGQVRVPEDEAHYSRAAMPVAAGDEGAVVWRFELVREGSGEGLASGTGVESRPLLSAPLTTIDPAGDWLMRCDSVAFPPGGQALLHTHAGPGIRCVQQGGIRIDAGGASHHHGLGEPWFEDGPTPVFAQADDVPTRFVRVSILPANYLGRSSIRYEREEDRDRPKDQTYRGYVDEPLRRRD